MKLCILTVQYIVEDYWYFSWYFCEPTGLTVKCYGIYINCEHNYFCDILNQIGVVVRRTTKADFVVNFFLIFALLLLYVT